MRSLGPSPGSPWKLQKCQGRLRCRTLGWEGKSLQGELALLEQSLGSPEQVELRLSLHMGGPAAGQEDLGSCG